MYIPEWSRGAALNPPGGTGSPGEGPGKGEPRPEKPGTAGQMVREMRWTPGRILQPLYMTCQPIDWSQ